MKTTEKYCHEKIGDVSGNEGLTSAQKNKSHNFFCQNDVNVIFDTNIIF